MARPSRPARPRPSPGTAPPARSRRLPEPGRARRPRASGAGRPEGPGSLRPGRHRRAPGEESRGRSVPPAVTGAGGVSAGGGGGTAAAGPRRPAPRRAGSPPPRPRPAWSRGGGRRPGGGSAGPSPFRCRGLRAVPVLRALPAACPQPGGAESCASWQAGPVPPAAGACWGPWGRTLPSARAWAPGAGGARPPGRAGTGRAPLPLPVRRAGGKPPVPAAGGERATGIGKNRQKYPLLLWVRQSSGPSGWVLDWRLVENHPNRDVK